MGCCESHDVDDVVEASYGGLPSLPTQRRQSVAASDFTTLSATATITLVQRDDMPNSNSIPVHIVAEPSSSESTQLRINSPQSVSREVPNHMSQESASRGSKASPPSSDNQTTKYPQHSSPLGSDSSAVPRVSGDSLRCIVGQSAATSWSVPSIDSTRNPLRVDPFHANQRHTLAGGLIADNNADSLFEIVDTSLSSQR